MAEIALGRDHRPTSGDQDEMSYARNIRAWALALAAVFVLSAVAAAAAQAVTVRLAGGGTALAEGADVKGESNNLKFVTAMGSLECTVNTLKGKVTANGTNPAKSEITEGIFTGNEGARCPTSIAVLGVKLTAEVKAEAFPWTLELGETGVSHVTRPKVKAKLFAGNLTVAECTYEAAAVGVGDAFEFEKSPLVDALVPREAEFSRTAGGTMCPEKGTLEGSITLTSEAKDLEAAKS